MTKKTKLELTWPGKEERPKLEPRILIEDPAKSYQAAVRREGDQFDNMLIKGDNLLALKALEADFAGKVKCVFIDPPYNTGSAFAHYDDGLEHSLWLSLMRDRLECIHRLLADDGSLWVTLDDNEAHYFKVMCDEVFGRGNFLADITWQHSVQGKNDAKNISNHHNHLFLYRRSEEFQRKLLPRVAEHNVNYRNPDSDPKGPWRSGDVRSPNLRENLRFVVITPSGKKIEPPEKGWRWAPKTFSEKVETGEITFVDNENRVLRKIYLSDQEGRVPESIWFAADSGTSRDGTSQLREVLSRAEDLLATVKPEQLLQRVFAIATNPGDLVLDSFAGSGTTGAVAHKMGRRWIMVEIGDHADTHIVPRMQKVIDSTDQGGISKAVDWQGGGGFRYYTLAPSLLEQDRWGNWVIAKEYNSAMLAEAMCKHLSFTYAPSQDEAEYWRHGQSSETDFIYVTTQSLTHEALRLLADEVGPDRSLMICARAFSGNIDVFENLTCRKIPSTILTKCEWGRDDYSLNIANLPAVEEAAPDDGPLFAAAEENADG